MFEYGGSFVELIGSLNETTYMALTAQRWSHQQVAAVVIILTALSIVKKSAVQDREELIAAYPPPLLSAAHDAHCRR